jgi:hypothetical protein
MVSERAKKAFPDDLPVTVGTRLRYRAAFDRGAVTALREVAEVLSGWSIPGRPSKAQYDLLERLESQVRRMADDWEVGQ